jgi:hypothetical protein
VDRQAADSAAVVAADSENPGNANLPIGVFLRPIATRQSGDWRSRDKTPRQLLAARQLFNPKSDFPSILFTIIYADMVSP